MSISIWRFICNLLYTLKHRNGHVLKKLLGDIQINFKSQHGSIGLQLFDLRQVIFHKINIMEEDISADFTETHHAAAAAFLYQCKVTYSTSQHTHKRKVMVIL